jgi:hypothetical protein
METIKHPIRKPPMHVQLEACAAPQCLSAARTSGYCPRHYQQVRRHGRLTPEREYSTRGQHCHVSQCHKSQIAKGLCFRHYQQKRRYGRLTPERERSYGRTGCQVMGCDQAHSSRGFCKGHYMSEYYLPLKNMHPSQHTARAA